jgi:hypothetical protein
MVEATAVIAKNERVYQPHLKVVFIAFNQAAA